MDAVSKSMGQRDSQRDPMGGKGCPFGLWGMRQKYRWIRSGGDTELKVAVFWFQGPKEFMSSRTVVQLYEEYDRLSPRSRELPVRLLIKERHYPTSLFTLFCLVDTIVSCNTWNLRNLRILPGKAEPVDLPALY